jgi:hypothetical protein
MGSTKYKPIHEELQIHLRERHQRSEMLSEFQAWTSCCPRKETSMQSGNASLKIGIVLAITMLVLAGVSLSATTKQDKPTYKTTGVEGTLVGTISFIGTRQGVNPGSGLRFAILDQRRLTNSR